MLHHESVAPETLGLLKSLSQLNSLNNFYLVGGTALALQIGHRISVDLDFFNSADYNVDEVFHVYKSLVYFDDADMQADLKMLIPAEWEEVKNYFSKQIRPQTP